MRGLKLGGAATGLGIYRRVAPLAGAWIETVSADHLRVLLAMSHPSRVRGLKLHHPTGADMGVAVAPLAGAWIET